ncbi:MAG: hypothetical protein WKF72_07495 [Nocardioidaceae bacterium]
MFLIVAALAVIGAVLSTSWILLVVASLFGVALGSAATRITHSELADARRAAAHDRAVQAQGYHDLTVERTAEHSRYDAAIQAQVRTYEDTISQLSDHLVTARGRVTSAHRLLQAEQRRSAQAEDRAAEAIVRVAELEQEIDVVTAEWRLAEKVRKHA